ncbi:hypothetical protein [Tenacibaculum jejuense]|uniref:hypothetical protein n=1 Tax=Tenacibaculum jejuense TaxID=584609 RepID=UPI0012FDB062|nr:hypothetical protein [Tenacibaculum jejuense]
MKEYFTKIGEFLNRKLWGLPYWAIGILPIALIVYLIFWLFKPKGSKNSKPW